MTATTATRRWRSDLPDVEVGGTTLPALVLERAAGLGDKPALVDATSGRTLSYRQLAEGSSGSRPAWPRAASPAATCSPSTAPTCPSTPWRHTGQWPSAAPSPGANPLLTTEELAGQLADAEARLLVTVPPFLDRALAAADKAGVQEVLVFGEAEARPPFGSCSPTSAPRRRSRSTRTATRALPCSAAPPGWPRAWS